MNNIKKLQIYAHIDEMRNNENQKNKKQWNNLQKHTQHNWKFFVFSPWFHASNEPKLSSLNKLWIDE
jgi:hypothetical protein